MDIWRQRNLVTAINLQADCLNAETLWLRFTFTLRDETVSPAQVESLFFRWLDAISALSEAQCQALCNFTQHAFMQLAPLEALRARAIGLLPPDPDGWPALLAALTPANASRLWASPEVSGETVESQGFTLTLAPFVPQAAHDEPVSFTPSRRLRRCMRLRSLQPLRRWRGNRQRAMLHCGCDHSPPRRLVMKPAGGWHHACAHSVHGQPARAAC